MDFVGGVARYSSSASLVDATGAVDANIFRVLCKITVVRYRIAGGREKNKAHIKGRARTQVTWAPFACHGGLRRGGGFGVARFAVTLDLDGWVWLVVLGPFLAHQTKGLLSPIRQPVVLGEVLRLVRGVKD